MIPNIIGTNPAFFTKKKTIPASGWKKKFTIAQITFSPVLEPIWTLKTMNHIAQTSIRRAPSPIAIVTSESLITNLKQKQAKNIGNLDRSQTFLPTITIFRSVLKRRRTADDFDDLLCDRSLADTVHI